MNVFTDLLALAAQHIAFEHPEPKYKKAEDPTDYEEDFLNDVAGS